MTTSSPHIARVAIAAGAIADLAPLRANFADAAEFVVGPIDTPELISGLTVGADALVVSLQRLSAEHLQALPQTIRAIGRAGVGLDTIDLASAAARGVPVIYQPSYATAEVAEHTVALVLAANRRSIQAHGAVMSGGWPTGLELGPVTALCDATVAIIGLGRIGRAVAQRIAPLANRMIGWDQQQMAVDGVDFIPDLSKALSQADIVCLHVPLTRATRHLIGAAELALLRESAIVVNTARGGLIDESALADTLRSSKIGGAALDVFQEEPLSPSSPLRGAPHLLLTPHIGWYSSASAPRLAHRCISDVVSYLRAGEIVYGDYA